MQSIQEQSADKQQNNTILAAIDLGSNSFHMIIAKYEHGEVRPIERLSEKIQLAKGLEDGNLSQESIDRGLNCLKRFQQLLVSLKPDHTRIIGTNTLRAAKNAQQFNRLAEEILGQPIEIVAGREEARLVYLGVSHTLADQATSNLVIDIGGGSTEFIIGQRFEAKQCESLHMGCVSYSNQFFPDNKISAARFKKAYTAACVEIRLIKSEFDGNWQTCIGSSGTFKALAAISELNNWSSEGITPSSLTAIKTQLLNAKHSDEIQLTGLSEHRREVITAGCAIACAIFDTLKIETMHFSVGALREGVIYDSLGRLSHEDIRERTIAALEQRYNISTVNLGDILIRCKHFFHAVSDNWNLNSTDLQFLLWAARLHGIGLTIAHTRYHRHGQYLLDNSDLPGFSRREQHLLAMLVRCHRRKLPKAELLLETDSDQKTLLRLIVLLRLALSFKYSELIERLGEITFEVKDNSLAMSLPSGWLENHPLTEAELALQQYRLGQVDFTLDIVSNT